jgi:hypothetical protein
MRKQKKKNEWVKCETCEYSSLTRRRTNPVVAICHKQQDVSPVTWMLEPKRELASILRVCNFYKKTNHEKEIKQIKD